MQRPQTIARSRWLQRQSSVTVAVLALFAGSIMVSASASAEELQPRVGVIPSAPPAVVTTVDGWTLTLAASNESKMTVPTPPNVPPTEAIVGGTFSAVIRGPGGTTRPAPSGHLEVGYQLQCIPSGLMAAMTSDTGVTTVTVLEEDFKTADLTATVANFHATTSCLGQVLIRSYAILTRTSGDADSVLAYYGVYAPL